MAALKKMTTKKVEEPKEALRKEPEKKAVAQKDVVQKAVAKVAEKKPVVKKDTAKKTELKTQLYVQFAGKSYSQEDLVKIAKDVWKYDLKKKVRDFKDVELYVKPEENQVYYVINKEVTGSFYI